jgi:3-phosphoshikimate 1-carboxyvinyltransferase
MLDALTAFGVEWLLDGASLTVQGAGPAGLKPPAAPVDCGSSGTTLRLLAGAVAAAGIPAVLDGSAGLRGRPMNRVVSPLREAGVLVDAVDGHAPLTFDRTKLPLTPPERYLLNVPSAQVKTCLLLAGLAGDRPTRIVEPGPSRDHSERMLAAQGAAVVSGRSADHDDTGFYEIVMEPPPALRWYIFPYRT